MDKNLVSGNTSLLILSLLAERDLYGYQMIETLLLRSDNTFALKAGTLYPLLHGLEQQGLVTAYEDGGGNARMRKYYRITPKGRGQLAEKTSQWHVFSAAVNRVLEGGAKYEWL